MNSCSGLKKKAISSRCWMMRTRPSCCAWQLASAHFDPKGTPPSLPARGARRVQDFSPLGVRVLLDCLDQRQSITLAEITQQHVMKDAGFTDWESFFTHLRVKGKAVNTLRVAYRSSREVVNFALQLLGDLREDEAPPITVRTGPPVELFRFTDHGA